MSNIKNKNISPEDEERVEAEIDLKMEEELKKYKTWDDVPPTYEYQEYARPHKSKREIRKENNDNRL